MTGLLNGLTAASLIVQANLFLNQATPFMKHPQRSLFTKLVLLSLPLVGFATPSPPMLEGTWALAYADVIHPDGTRARDFGDTPKGILQIDREGRYSIFIFNAARPKFAAGERNKGTADEFRAAVLGSSSHYGSVSADTAAGTLTFRIEGSTYPNWEGTTQVRKYELVGDVLSYKVPPRENGDVPITGWKRLSAK